MAKINFKNTFGSMINQGGTGLDLQRVDLFKVTLVLPAALNLDTTVNVEFAVEGSGKDGVRHAPHLICARRLGRPCHHVGHLGGVLAGPEVHRDAFRVLDRGSAQGVQAPQGAGQ